MELTSLHILLTYQCTCECEHCFVWGSSARCWAKEALSTEIR